METNCTSNVLLQQPVEYIDAICLDKSIILPDGCTTATLTTADGEALPITLIVSESMPSSNEDNTESLQETITADTYDDSSNRSNNENACLEGRGAEAQTVYAIHFSNELDAQSTIKYEEVQENSVLPDDKTDMTAIDNSTHPDPVENQFDPDIPQTVTRLEDFMDVVTTYKCKFCRFACPWKSGLMSHIRCCHVEERKRLLAYKEEKYKYAGSSKGRKRDHYAEEKKKELQIEESVAELSSSLKQNERSPCSVLKSEVNEGKTNTKSPLLERHIFLCGQCSDGFVSLEACKQHMINDHKLKLEQSEIKPVRKRGRPRTRPYIDPVLQHDGSIDSGIDGNVSESKRHCRPPKNLEDDYEYGVKRKVRRESLNDKAFRCTRSGCGHRFSNESHLQYHYTCHSDDGKPFICPDCKEEFDHWRGLVMHLWKEHAVDVDLHTCSDCGYKTYSYFKLDNHRKIHSEERAFVCQTCGKGFKQISQLRNHLVIHLDRKNLPEKRWYSKQKCETCSRTFSDTKCLRKHQQAVHSKLKPYICSYCGHLSARKAMLELHMRQHTGEKPFLCEHCDYRTGDHNSLRRHRMRHTGAKPYKCPHCPYACIQAISYKTHLKNKHPGMDGLYACSLCTFKSVSKENYMNHMSDHKRQSGSLADETTSELVSTNTENPLESVSNEQSSAHMHLPENALQQLEGILPGNITAAQLIYSCLNALSQDGGTVNLPPGVTVNIPPSATTAADGTQTITIQLPSAQEAENEPYYFTIQQQEGTTTAVMVPSVETNDGLDNTSVIEGVTHEDVSTDLNSSILPDEDEGGNLNSGNSDSLVIAHIESFNEAEHFSSTEVMEESEDIPNES